MTTTTEKAGEQWRNDGLANFFGIFGWEWCIEDAEGRLIALVPAAGHTQIEAAQDERSRSMADLIASAPEMVAELAALRAERERHVKALERIVGMCEVPATCTCGRPNGIGAVVACAKRALTPEPAP